MSRPATARLFVALDLPAEVRESLAAWARSATRQAKAEDRAAEHERDPRGYERDLRDLERGRPRRRSPDRHGLRMLDAEAMHLTVVFLGPRPVEEVEPLCSLVESQAPPQMGESSLGAPLWLPRRRPHALAVEVHDDSGAITALHQALNDSLQAAGLASREAEPGAGRRRPLRPHVTVARMRSGAAPRQRTLAPTPQRSFTLQRLTLYRSWLSPEGASYEALASCETAGAAAGG